MPRYYRARGSRYVRRYRRRTGVLSTRNIYARRSSYSQASQIAALRKRVSKVYKACKPERKVAFAPIAQLGFASHASGNVDYKLDCIALDKGANDDQRVGDKVYRKDVYNFSLEYYNNSETGYHDGESSGCQIRVIVGQYKSAINNATVPTVDTIISQYATSGEGYTAAAVSPLVNGVTDTYHIFSDKVYYMTNERNQKIIKVKTPWYNCRYTDGDSPVRSNHSFCIIVVAGLHYDANFTEYVSGVLTRKTVFTDA